MDKSLVKKIPTYKTGPFTFSRNYSQSRELWQKLARADTLWKTVKDLPILPNLSTQLEEEVMIKSIFSTAAIEGNPLPEEKVSEVILKSSQEVKRNAEKEIRNLKTAYDFIGSLQCPDPPFELSEELIKRIHSIIVKDIQPNENTPGQYRNHRVKVGDKGHGGIYTPPKILEDIRTLMKEFIVWINSEESLKEDSIVRAALAHYHLALIHPFSDGNGRTARLIEALLLRSVGIKYTPVMLSNFYYRNIDEYFWVFSRSIKDKNHDITPFLDFVVTGVIESLTEIKDRITFLIRKFTLQDYYRYLRNEKVLTKRQYLFLTTLLDNPTKLTLQDLSRTSPFASLYSEVSERTARRDLGKLCDNNLLLKENGRYILNIQALE